MQVLVRSLMLAGLLTLAQGAAAAPSDSPRELAALYIRELEPTLTGQDAESLASVRNGLQAASGQPGDARRELIGLLVSETTTALATGQSPDAVTVIAAHLVQADPENWRTLNLFGTTLQNNERYVDAVSVLRPALALAPDDPANLTLFSRRNIVRVNLANTYLDLGKLAEAKQQIDEALRSDPDSREAWRAKATYCFQAGDRRCHGEALLKLSRFGGYIRQKQEDAETALDEKLKAPAGSDQQTAAKLHALADSLPVTMADVLEQDEPDAAAKLREHFLKLHGDERMTIPRFPVLVDTTSNRRWLEQQPIIEAWLASIAERKAETIKEQYGIRDGASDAANAAAGQAAAMQQLQAQFQQTAELLKYAENMPGVDLAQLRSARKELERKLAEHGVRTGTETPADSQAPPGYDQGSVFAVGNYGAYLKITRAFEQELDRLYTEMSAAQANAVATYQLVRKPEDNRHAVEMQRCKQFENTALVLCKREESRHARVINDLSDAQFKQYINAYLPRMEQLYKPLIEDYWKVSAIYIRNMQDPAVMQREYLRAKGRFADYALRFAGGVGVGFQYMPVDEEDEQVFEQAIDEAKVRAPAVKTECLDAYQLFSAIGDWIEPYNIKLVFGPAELKISSGSIELEGFAPVIPILFPGSGIGGFGSVKLDLKKLQLVAGVGAGVKITPPIVICSTKNPFEIRADVVRAQVTWDFVKDEFVDATGGNAVRVLGVPVAVQTLTRGDLKIKFGDFLTSTAKYEKDASGASKVEVRAAIPQKNLTELPKGSTATPLDGSLSLRL